LVSLWLFLFQVLSLNRLPLVVYILTSSLTHCAYRLSLRAYCSSRARGGAWASSVLIVGYEEAVDHVARALADPQLQALYRPIGYIGDAGNNGSSDRGSIGSSFAEAAELNNAPGEGTGPAGHAELAGDSVGRVPSRAALEVLPQAAAPPTLDFGLWTVDSPRSSLIPSPPPLARPPRLGGFNDLRDLLNNRPINKVIMVLPSAETEWAGDVIDACDELGVTLRVVPESLLFHTSKALRHFRHSDGLPLPGVLLVPKHYGSEALFIKHCVDFLGAAALLVLVLPLLAVVALLIKRNEPRSPLLFRYRAIGKNGLSFTAYKFRTMIPGAEKLKDQLLDQNEMEGPVFKMKNDPRITPIGRFLRKYSIDELPQLWNVLQGDLSLVGPRPPWPQECQRYAFWQKRRLSVKPGITCLWQVRGRNKVRNFDDWVNMDIEYIDNWSLWLDFKILVWTIPAVLRGTGC
jgi:exopolysaccharide biosynthesis polyprenyl glycosylphosphotransferase